MQWMSGFGKWLAAVAAAIGLAGCGGGGGGDATVANGTLRLALTDRPACGYDAVYVTIQKVRVHQGAGAGDGDAGWAEVVLQPARRIDLLTLQNGVLDELGQTSLPAGKYTQMRLVLAENGTSAPWANSLVPTAGTELPLTTPSALQSGLKLNINIEVPAGQLADVVIDFDACRSVVKRGNSGQYNLKPVLSVTPRVSFGVIGYVPAELSGPATTVSAQVAGIPVKSTTPAQDGKFVLAPLAGGPFDVVISAAGRVTATITGVPEPATADIKLNNEQPISPAASDMRTVSGSVTTGASPILATVAARKAYTGGPTVEVAGASVDGDTGAFSFELAGGAPEKAEYVAGLLTFNTDGATPTGQYQIAATSGGASKTASADVTIDHVSGMTFEFP